MFLFNEFNVTGVMIILFHAHHQVCWHVCFVNYALVSTPDHSRYNWWVGSGDETNYACAAVSAEFNYCELHSKAWLSQLWLVVSISPNPTLFNMH